MNSKSYGDLRQNLDFFDYMSKYEDKINNESLSQILAFEALYKEQPKGPPFETTKRSQSQQYSQQIRLPQMN